MKNIQMRLIQHESKALSLLLAVPEYGVSVHADI
jgi:hypothetical protein